MADVVATDVAVSALMIVRNRATLIADSIRSVMSQTGPSWELLVVDDGSVDDTLTVAHSFAARDPRVRVLPSCRLGIPATRNRGLAAARGRYLAICDSDDLSHPGRFAAQTAALDADPGLVGVGSRFRTFIDDPSDAVVADWRWGLRGGRGPFAFPTAMLRTAAVRAVGGFDPAFPIVEDLDLCYRLAGRGGRFAILPDVLVDYRISPHGVSQGNPDLFRYAAKAQLRGLRQLHGGFTPAGYLTLMQTLARATRDRYRSRFSRATAR